MKRLLSVMAISMLILLMSLSDNHQPGNETKYCFPLIRFVFFKPPDWRLLAINQNR